MGAKVPMSVDYDVVRRLLDRRLLDRRPLDRRPVARLAMERPVADAGDGRDQQTQAAREQLKRRRLAALLSVHHHTDQRGASGVPMALLPRELRPLSLAEATDVLRSDETREGVLAQVHAGAKMMEACVHERPGHEETVDRLVPVDVQRAAIHGLEVAAAEDVLPDWTPVHVERRWFRRDLEYDPDSQVTVVRAGVEVKGRAFSDLVQVFAPQNWKKDDFFEASDAVVIDSGTGAAHLDEDHKKAGETWKGPLFEHFVWSLRGEEVSWFKNFLDIDACVCNLGDAPPLPELPTGAWQGEPWGGTPPRPPWMWTNYSLRKAIRSQIWLEERPGGIDVDSGHICISADEDHPDWWRVEVVKHVRFTSAGRVSVDAGEMMNYMTPAILRSWLERGVYEGVLTDAP
jgi:hypothetical protein